MLGPKNKNKVKDQERLHATRKSYVDEKVFAHRSSKKASAFSCPTRDRKDAVDHFASPKSGLRTLLWDFFINVTSACATSDYYLATGSNRSRHVASRGDQR